MTSKFLLRVLGLLAAFTLVAAACGSDEASETDTGSGDEDGSAGGGLEGAIVVSGSSTVEPISVAVAESYKGIEPDVNISVTGPGTGDGFKEFCAGNTDISDASRQIKDEEAASCSESGVNYVELKVGIDGIAVMTSADNAGLECLSFGDLYALVGPESVGIETWGQAEELAAEVGGVGGYPEGDLVIAAPGTESGTYDSFTEIVLEDLAEEREQEAAPRLDYTSAADDNLIIESISTNPTSFGWVGFAFAAEASNVKLVPIAEEAGGDCIEPTPDTIASNEYPISRDLFIYINTDKAAESDALVSFVDHYMGFGLDEATAAVGYVPLTDDAKAEVRSAWDGR